MHKGWHLKETTSSCSGMKEKIFSDTVVLADTLQQSDTPGLGAHSAPSPDMVCLLKGPEVNCSVSLDGQCNGARLGEHLEGQRPAFIIFNNEAP